ncbi:PH domain-containing protein [Bacillus sp. B15-48]|uniref:PH domain-containing protein n=1 Tax=Bacillus sp. B15-48 TaxID=1548601 RepID=UPI00193F35B4|nr:PH domain-containing protein [Bacillus sp. B15-48]MBM4765392.1 PH domain-containing protein [Bacillus sp. B15-48]
MIPEPKTRISQRALTVWKISGMIQSAILWIFGAVFIALAVIFNWPTWMIVIIITIGLLYSSFMILFLPKLRWRRWRYEVREQEIELQRGVFIIKRTLIPMIRVQHVDTQQGPILRKYRLSTVMISTAATIHEIPALDMEEAEELRHSISKLARVADEDV